MAKALKLLAASAGIAASVIVAMKMIEHYESKQSEKCSAFEKLIETQLVCDLLDGSVISEWFRKQQENLKEELVFFLAKPTIETVKMFSLDHIPEQLDCCHCLLQAAVNAESYEVAAIRLISYNEIAERIDELLREKDYVIVKGENADD